MKKMLIVLSIAFTVIISAGVAEAQPVNIVGTWTGTVKLVDWAGNFSGEKTFTINITGQTGGLFYGDVDAIGGWITSDGFSGVFKGSNIIQFSSSNVTSFCTGKIKRSGNKISLTIWQGNVSGRGVVKRQ